MLAVVPCKHDRAATEAQLPIGNAIVGRLKVGQQRNPVRTGNDLERCDQHAPSGIPFDIDFRRIDRHWIIGRIAVRDMSRTCGQLTPEIGRQAVTAQFTFQFAGERQIRAVGEVLHPQRQQDIRSRNLVGANIDRSHAVRGRSDHDAQRPGIVAFFTDAQRHPAGARPPKTESDVFEIPFVAALLIVNDKVSVLQTDFVEVLSVQSGQAQTVEPIEAGKQAALGAIGTRWRSGGWGRRRNCAGWCYLARKRRRNACLFL